MLTCYSSPFQSLAFHTNNSIKRVVLEGMIQTSILLIDSTMALINGTVDKQCSTAEQEGQDCVNC
jgi:hypothetical protein